MVNWDDVLIIFGITFCICLIGNVIATHYAYVPCTEADYMAQSLECGFAVSPRNPLAAKISDVLGMIQVVSVIVLIVSLCKSETLSKKSTKGDKEG